MTPFSLWRRGNGLYYVTVHLPDGKKQYRSLGDPPPFGVPRSEVGCCLGFCSPYICSTWTGLVGGGYA